MTRDRVKNDFVCFLINEIHRYIEVFVQPHFLIQLYYHHRFKGPFFK